jgi:DNA (cytosine-5)-methyltransferase 1
MRELIVDLFAGGGGASLGIEQALGRSPDIAINHDAEAVALHQANHPHTRHFVSDVWEVDPKRTCAGRPVGLLWASPDCKHFSKAKGGQPVKARIRALAWVVAKWARDVRPRVIIIENVEEFADWGPLVQKVDAFGVKVYDLHGSPVMVPCKKRKGETFHRLRRQFERYGYVGEWRERRAYRTGAGTIRKRLYWILRCDGRPIVWPSDTHEDPKKNTGLLPWVTAADSIDFSLPCPSIFETAAEIKRKHGVRAIRPLKTKTMARLAKGTFRYVIDSAEPFIIPVTHGGDIRVNPVGEPLRTGTCARRGEHALVTPFVTKFRSGATGQPLTESLATITAHHSEVHPAGMAPLGLVTPFLVPRYQERPGQEPRTRSIELPVATQVPGGNEGVLAVPHLMTMRNADKPHEAANKPAHTLTAGGARPTVVAAFLAQHNTDMVGHDTREPVSTIVQKGCTQGVVQAELAASAGVLNLKGSDRRASSIEAPTPTDTAQGRHIGEVRAFLTKYYGEGLPSQACDEPVHTGTAKPRFGVVEAVALAPPFGPEHWERARKVADFLRSHGYWDEREFVTIEIGGVTLVIVDIGMRMLTPRERYNAQGFPPDYKIEIMVDKTVRGRLVRKPLSAEAQGRMVGNSVCPTESCALVAANSNDLAVTRRRATA